MPKGNWGHHGYDLHREHERVFPQLEQTPDLSRGAERLAAEALLATVSGRRVPASILRRAIAIAAVMAKG